MSYWDREDRNTYTDITAQRRNRRKADWNPQAPAKPAEQDGGKTPEEKDLDSLFAAYARPSSYEKPKEPERVTEPEEEDAAKAFAEPVTPEEPKASVEPETPETAEKPEEAEAPEETDGVDKPAEPEKEKEPDEMGDTLEHPVVQGADSRVPPEARRMAAAPYGTARPGARRPGTRPQEGYRRPALPDEKRVSVHPRQEVRDAARRERQEAPGRLPERQQRVRVGYAPGRMTDDTRQVPVQDPSRESYYSRDAKAYLEKRSQPFRTEGPVVKPMQDRPGHKVLRIAVALLVLAGLALSAKMFLDGRNGKDAIIPKSVPQVYDFVPPDTTGLTAPAELPFAIVTEKDVEEIRLVADGDRDVETEVTSADNADGKRWMMKMPVETGFKGTVTLQVRRTGSEEWMNTAYTAEVNVETPPGMDVPEPTAPPAENADNGVLSEGDDDYYNPEGDADPGEEAPASGEVPDEVSEETDEEGEIEAAPMWTPAPTDTPAPVTPEPTATPPLTAEAVPEANPDLITQTVVWTGVAKKDKDYNRPAKDVVKMPEADEYYSRPLGVLTFRGDNFRRNAAAGTLSAEPLRLSVLWQTEAGYARGTNKTYYGYEWTGQPVIALWSKEVRTKSNFTETKIEKSALKEVIIAGVDGAVRFLDLQDGKYTRNGSIKLNYPMKGTPTLDPRGAPFMTVGQYTRKMKGRTAGKIGLRQYNLYTQNELKIIDGLDGKYHRPLNDIGSFETSALIDRVSDTLIVAGTNGMLYLETLGMTFDYNLGVMPVSPNVVAMSSRAKGQKSNSLVAVESSLAAYSNYVWYADMGGVLRCVDTNKLAPVWAVDTGDSVMAAVALDLTKDRNLDLYTANMLNNRKKGNSNVQIRRYDALTGREIWCTDVGVYKGKKDKTKDNVGAKASPVIGLNGLNDLVYFTVTGLSEEGAEKLHVKAGTQAALISLSKNDGRVVWAYGLDSRSESSPIALYDDYGRGWIVQCEQSGKIHLLDGLTGGVVDVLEIDGEIEASPAAYNNVVVIGTTGKGKANVYGIEVKLNKPEESTATPAPAEDGQGGSGEEGEAAENGEEAYDEGDDYDEGDAYDGDGGYGEEDEYEEYEEYDPDGEEEGGIG